MDLIQLLALLLVLGLLILLAFMFGACAISGELSRREEEDDR